MKEKWNVCSTICMALENSYELGLLGSKSLEGVDQRSYKSKICTRNAAFGQRTCLRPSKFSLSSQKFSVFALATHKKSLAFGITEDDCVNRRFLALQLTEGRTSALRWHAIAPTMPRRCSLTNRSKQSLTSSLWYRRFDRLALALRARAGAEARTKAKAKRSTCKSEMSVYKSEIWSPCPCLGPCPCPSGKGKACKSSICMRRMCGASPMPMPFRQRQRVQIFLQLGFQLKGLQLHLITGGEDDVILFDLPRSFAKRFVRPKQGKPLGCRTNVIVLASGQSGNASGFRLIDPLKADTSSHVKRIHHCKALPLPEGHGHGQGVREAAQEDGRLQLQNGVLQGDLYADTEGKQSKAAQIFYLPIDHNLNQAMKPGPFLGEKKSVLEILQQIKDAICKKQLIACSTSVIVSISGGQDSIFLLFCLSFLQSKIDFTFKMFWCNHFWQTDSFYTTLHLTMCAVNFRKILITFLPLFVFDSDLLIFCNTHSLPTVSPSCIGLQIEDLTCKADTFGDALANRRLACAWPSSTICKTWLSVAVQSKALLTNQSKHSLTGFSSYKSTSTGNYLRNQEFDNFLAVICNCTYGAKRMSAFNCTCSTKESWPPCLRPSDKGKANYTWCMSHHRLASRCPHTNLLAYLRYPLTNRRFVCGHQRFALDRHAHALRARARARLANLRFACGARKDNDDINKRSPKMFAKAATSETIARHWRHLTTERSCTFYSLDKAIYGHTLSDRVETIMFNLIRGTGNTGIQSLLWKRKFSTFFYNWFFLSFQHVFHNTHFSTSVIQYPCTCNFKMMAMYQGRYNCKL